MHKLFEHDCRKKSKVYDKIDAITVRIRITYNVKHRYAIRLKFGEIFVTSQTKLVLEAKASIFATIKENLL